MKRQPTRQQAFTLLEILVSTTIVAVLAAALIPSIRSMTARAESTRCLGHLKSLGVAMGQYLADNSMTLPLLAAARSSTSEELPVIDTVLAPYVEDLRVFTCPSDSTIAKQTGTSYFYNSALGGQSVASLNFLGVTDANSRIPVLVDKEGWHKSSQSRVNHLFADGHAGSEFRLFAE
ncbi:MAG: type II secretion system protein [Terrimicrobiaceae bacterium]